ncbi:hypothetical protein BT96DRAFT_696421 [Gymnopus androsaceus JB14]|uniref:Uncharacterized protein n=1 Tax=Gymnopus androsaceus JB14 TaxID=1447944 RepID=A0A6A4ICI1_9AGAR|nr:hypothetical protein BT96DRAFT_696421 [Gymnopus androsaceus JB14]
MQAPTRSNRARVGGYSDFFSSGFRAITSRNNTVSSRPRPSSTYSLPTAHPILTRSKSSSNRRQSGDSGDSGRPQSPKFSKDSKSNNIPSSSSTEKQRKRMSFMEFSAKLFDKITPGVSEAQSFVEFDETKRRLRPRTRNSSSDWSGPNPRTQMSSIRTVRTRYPANETDPFNSSPDSKSFFIGLSDSSSSSSPRRSRHQSYISFSGSSLSSLTSFARRERPTSIHSLPAALPPSRRSSYLSSSLEKYDSLFQEESSILESPYENENENDDRDLANIDWRDFHIQLFDNV